MRVVRERQEPMVSLSFHPAKQQELQSAEMEKTTEGARLWGKKSEITIWTCWVWHVKRKCWGDDWIHKFKVQERGQDYNDKSMSHQQINLKPVMAGWDHEGNGSWRERKVRLSEMGQRRWMRAEPLHRQWFQERGEASQEAAKEVGGNPARDVLSWKPSKGEDVKEEEVICCTRRDLLMGRVRWKWEMGTQVRAVSMEQWEQKSDGIRLRENERRGSNSEWKDNIFAPEENNQMGQ